jgi:kelch-like protein 20
MLTNNNHPVQSLNGLNLLRTEKKLCDVTIKAEDAMFHAHRAVLASSSPYFFAMFCRDMKETGNPSVTIHDVPAHVMEAIINYCYTATIEVNEDNVQELLPAACLFQLTWVRDACCDFLKEQLCPSNCLGVKGFADAHSCTDLCLAASNFAQQHFIDIIECEEFLELLPRQLIDLLKSEELNVQNEEKVYESVMKWVKHDPSNRQQYLADLLKHVRLPLVDRNFLVSIVGTEPLIRQIEACRDLLDEAKDYLLLPEQREKFEGPRTRHRKPKMSNANQTLFAIGGWCNGNAISTVEKYNPPKDEWIQMGDMAKRRCGVGIAVLNNSIFAIGGHDGTSYLNSIEKYDLLTDLWSSNVAPTSACRTSVGVAVLNGQIYAVGGQDGISCLNLVEW